MELLIITLAKLLSSAAAFINAFTGLWRFVERMRVKARRASKKAKGDADASAVSQSEGDKA